MISRIFKHWPSRVLVILVLCVSIIFVKEKLDNRVYIGNVAETEVPLALNGDLALAHSFGTYFVHDASTGTTASLPDIRMPSEIYMPVPTCAAGDEIILERATKEPYWRSFFLIRGLIFDRFRWSRSGLELIVPDEFSGTEEWFKLDPWTCVTGPDVLPALADISGTGSERHLELTGTYPPIKLPPIGGAHKDQQEQRYMWSLSVGPAAEPDRFLVSDRRHGLQWPHVIILDRTFTEAHEIILPDYRWMSDPVEDTDSCSLFDPCSFFRNYDFKLAGDHLFAILTGERMFVRDAGIYRLNLTDLEAGWTHLLAAGINRSVAFSQDGCHAAVSDGRVRIVDLCD